MHRLYVLLSLLFCIPQTINAQTDWRVLQTGSAASLRGVTVARHTVDARPVIWAAGAKGTVLVTSDLGKSWREVGPQDHSQLEFRSLYAWNELQCIVASAGTPAIVLKTDNGGQRWREVHRDPRPQAFFDGLKFLDARRGVLFGDPIDGRFVVLVSTDQGETWQPIDREALPPVVEGETAFAASNSAMIVAPPGNIWIGTGGAKSNQSRVLSSRDFGKSWQVSACPLHSAASSGIFSLALSEDNAKLVAVGGDYQPEARSLSTAALSGDQGQSFQVPRQPPTSFRSAVVWSNDRFVATGPSGTDTSTDGQEWIKLSDTGFHALAVLPDGQVIAVGSDGRFGLW